MSLILLSVGYSFKYEKQANSFATLLLLNRYLDWFKDKENITMDNISYITKIPLNIIKENKKNIYELIKGDLGQKNKRLSTNQSK